MTPAPGPLAPHGFLLARPDRAIALLPEPRAVAAMHFRWGEKLPGPEAGGGCPAYLLSPCIYRACCACNQSAFWQNELEFRSKNNDGENRGLVS